MILGSFANACFGIVQFLVISIYPLLARNLNLDLATIILSFTLGSLCFVFSSPFWATKSDVIGRQRVISLGLVGLALSFLVLIFLSSLNLSSTWNITILLLSRIFYGLTASSIVTGVQLWWKDEPGDDARKMINHSMSLNLGRLIAPIIVLLTQGHLMMILWVIFSITLILAIIMGLQENKLKTSSNPTGFKFQFFPAQKLILASALFIGLIHSNLASEIMKNFNFDVQVTSLLTSKLLILSSLVAFISQLIARRVKSLGVNHILKIGLVTWIISGICFSYLNHEIFLWLAVFFFSVGISLFLPGILALQKTSSEVGSTNSLIPLGMSLGGALGWLVIKDITPFSIMIMILLSSIIFVKSRVHAV